MSVVLLVECRSDGNHGLISAHCAVHKAIKFLTRTLLISGCPDYWTGMEQCPPVNIIHLQHTAKHSKRCELMQAATCAMLLC